MSSVIDYRIQGFGGVGARNFRASHEGLGAGRGGGKAVAAFELFAAAAEAGFVAIHGWYKGTPPVACFKYLAVRVFIGDIAKSVKYIVTRLGRDPVVPVVRFVRF